VSAASCAGRYGKPKGYLAYKKEPINNNSGSQTSSLDTGKEYQSTRITHYSGQKIHPNFVSTSWRHPWDPIPMVTLKRMSVMANTTPLVTTVTKPTTNPRHVDATPRVNTQDFYEEYYEDILPVIMEKVRRDKRKEVHARLDFGKISRERRTREDSHYSSHRRQSAFDRLSNTYSLSTTKSRPRGTDSRDHPWGRRRPHRLDTSNEDCSKDMERFRGVGESYDDSFSHSYRDGNRSRHMKRRRDNESPLSSVSKSDPSDRRYRKSRSKRHKSTDDDNLTMPWMCEEKDPFTPRILWFDELPPESVDSYKDLKAAFLAYFMQQKKYVKDPVEIHNIKQKDGETIEDFMERFKVETGPMKGPLNEKLPLLATRKVTRHGRHMTSQKGKLQKKGLTSGITQGKEGDLTSSPLYKDAKRDSCGRGGQKVAQSFEQVKEITFPPLTANREVEGPLVIEAKMGRHMIHRMYVDGGSSMEILYEHCFNRLRPEIKNQRSMDEIQAVPSTAYGMLKFTVEGGIVTIRSTILIPAECTSVNTSLVVSKEEGIRLENFKVALHPDFPDQEVAIEGTLSAKGRTELCSIPKKNLDIFAWQPSDMTGVPRSVAEHRLNIREGYSPVRQKKRGQAPERAKAIQAEVQKLVEAWIMREDCYPLPEIDWKVESLCGYPFKCFLDAYKGYYQIQLADSDEDKTAFHTGLGMYCYTKMPFGLKNAGATYQRLVDKAFDCQIGWNIEVYVNDLVVKSYTEAEMLRDIDETFRTLRKINMKLNPKKSSNNEAEYKALIAGLRIAAQMGVQNVLVEILKEKSIKEKDVTTVVEEDGPTWMTPIVEYLKEGTLPSDRTLHAVVPYAVVKMCWTAPREIHCPVTRNPQQPLTPIMASWPFYKWGIDIASPFPKGPEIGMPTYRTAAVDVVYNDEELRLNLDLLKERRERAAIREAKAKLKMKKYYNARVRGITFRPGDFVYRSNDASHAVAGGKLGQKWEGPYEVTEALGDGAYKLRSTDGTILPRTWNIANLKRCYL
nr:reverse transcriptase domain-containing protein [Tanacetum cinerariifolium]GEZ12227.1 reverse transcriptase domain-containing protein [Tanacetum cinerariifolium]